VAAADPGHMHRCRLSAHSITITVNIRRTSYDTPTILATRTGPDRTPVPGQPTIITQSYGNFGLGAGHTCGGSTPCWPAPRMSCSRRCRLASARLLSACSPGCWIITLADRPASPAGSSSSRGSRVGEPRPVRYEDHFPNGPGCYRLVCKLWLTLVRTTAIEIPAV
jgi:hypothetical protein